MWYTAHVVIQLRTKEEPQAEFCVWENVILIEAKNEEEALEKAEVRGREDEGEFGLTINGKSAEFVYVGLRKLMACSDGERTPSDGTELSFNRLYFASQQDLDDFAEGKEVPATFDDEEPLDE